MNTLAIINIAIFLYLIPGFLVIRDGRKSAVSRLVGCAAVLGFSWIGFIVYKLASRKAGAETATHH
ncbi:hypothetical protein [Marilutibacter chinensis]|uniref:Cardiolipin synthase N-terminal domain-containing protein n=1 Tax=Marilutibacter chinensis TaxID=2912247 RepID=A0ABS9HR96_9GAMM|nr:hypothetical protein [Lysobacter chinensis]MCF7220759.1 hypothetical protein [Lysobacter chinensis]